MESTITKRKKLCESSPSVHSNHSLDKICDYAESERVAVKYFEIHENTKEITYSQLRHARIEVSNILRDAKAQRFVGIAADTPAYCLPALMLGTLASGRAFACLPPSASEVESLSQKLNLRQIFSPSYKEDTRIVRDFNVHAQKIFLYQIEKPHTNDDFSPCKVPERAFAYAITTSGTAGEPKIVRVTHASIVPNIIDLKRILDVSASDAVAQITPLSFDPSIIEIFLPLSCEATVLMVSSNLKNDPDALLKTLVKGGVSVLQSTPSLLTQRWSSEQLKKSLLGDQTTLRILLLGGENFPNENVLSEIRASDNRTRIFDIYGITEVSCWACIREIDKHDSPKGLGQTMDETILEVRDECGKRVEQGEGTLYIGSDSRVCVIDDEDVRLLNKPVFRDTGDIVVIDENGHVNLKGRRGRRIKRYGTKLHLTDLENHVQKLPFVENCYALFTESDQYLHLYFTLFDKTANASEKSKYEYDVFAHTKKLSDIYRPDLIVTLNGFQLTSNGKICERFLKKMSRRYLKVITSNDDIPHVLETFKNIWNRFLSSAEGFLDSGGSSVIALRISNQLEDKTGRQFPKLMSFMLGNKNFSVCQEYVRGQMSNSSNPRGDAISANKIAKVESNETLARGYVEISSENTEDCEEQKKATVRSPVRLDKSIDVCTKRSKAKEKKLPWQKCRGRNDFPGSTNSEQNEPWKKCTKIRPAYHYNLGKCVDASPTIFSYPGGKSYVTVGSHAGVICTVELTKESPVEHWEVVLPDRIEASILVVNDFRGIVGSYDTFVYCIDLKSGEHFWKFKTGDIVKCSAVLCSKERNIFFGSYDRRIYCVSVENGSEVWSVKAGDGSICATPCVNDVFDCILFASLDGTCISVGQNSGEVNWSHKLDYPVFSGPAILENGLCVFCDVAGGLHFVSAVTGQRTQSLKIDGNIFSHLSVCKNVERGLQSVLLASENSNLYMIDCPFEGTEPIFRYVKNIGAPIASTPFSDGATIVVASNDGNLTLLDSFNGEILYSIKLGGDVFSSPVIHEDFIVVGCRDNRLYILLKCEEASQKK